MGLQEEPVAPYHAAKMATGYVSENLLRTKPSHTLETDKAVEMIDDKRILGELIEEMLPVFRKMKHLDSIDDMMNASSKFAAMVLYKTMMFGDTKEARAAANDILNRSQGKPIERQMSVSMNMNTLSMTEVDNEIKRVLAKFNTGRPKEIVEITSGEGEDMGGDET